MDTGQGSVVSSLLGVNYLVPEGDILNRKSVFDSEGSYCNFASELRRLSAQPISTILTDHLSSMDNLQLNH